MMEITAEIRALIDKAAAGVELAGDEYIDPADGLIHCKKCGGQRQTVVLGVVQIRDSEPQTAGLSFQKLLLRCNPGRNAYEETQTEKAQP